MGARLQLLCHLFLPSGTFAGHGGMISTAVDASWGIGASEVPIFAEGDRAVWFAANQALRVRVAVCLPVSIYLTPVAADRVDVPVMGFLGPGDAVEDTQGFSFQGVGIFQVTRQVHSHNRDGATGAIITDLRETADTADAGQPVGYQLLLDFVLGQGWVDIPHDELVGLGASGRFQFGREEVKKALQDISGGVCIEELHAVWMRQGNHFKRVVTLPDRSDADPAHGAAIYGTRHTAAVPGSGVRSGCEDERPGSLLRWGLGRCWRLGFSGVLGSFEIDLLGAPISAFGCSPSPWILPGGFVCDIHGGQWVCISSLGIVGVRRGLIS